MNSATTNYWGPDEYAWSRFFKKGKLYKRGGEDKPGSLIFMFVGWENGYQTMMFLETGTEEIHKINKNHQVPERSWERVL